VEALSLALDRNRAHYNALFAEARQRNAGLEGKDVLEHLTQRIAPIFRALPPALSEEAQDRVLEALYRASLELIILGLLGNHSKGSINAVWESLLPSAAHLIALAPRRVVAALSNAAFNLDQAPSARAAEWLERMLAVIVHCFDIETLIATGQVAAWRAGMPQFRSGALALCPTLPPSVLRTVLDAPGTQISPFAEGTVPAADASVERLMRKRFAYSNADTRSLISVARLGGFTGFGGQFITPPQLTVIEGSLIAHDHESAWEIHADVFGALLLRRQSLPHEWKTIRNEQPVTIDPDGRVHWGDLSSLFPELAGAVHFAWDAELLAIVPPRSHYIHLIAVAEGRPC
jgi:hypothetical protein